MIGIKKFQRKKEDFLCEKCGAHVLGDGFTNHCPMCLWSKHVDIYPGDRKAVCGGLMKPVGVEVHGTKYSIVHVCTNCKHRRKNKSSKKDNFELLVAISTQPI